jgi:hypothetical protein
MQIAISWQNWNRAKFKVCIFFGFGPNFLLIVIVKVSRKQQQNEVSNANASAWTTLEEDYILTKGPMLKPV